MYNKKFQNVSHDIFIKAFKLVLNCDLYWMFSNNSLEYLSTVLQSGTKKFSGIFINIFSSTEEAENIF